MADLPPDRVTPDKPPFTREPEVVTREEHLEAAQSTDHDSLVNSIRRFIARRGTPEVM